MSSAFWKAAIFRLLFLLLAAGAGTTSGSAAAGGTASGVDCHEINATKPFAQWKECTFDPLKGIGNSFTFGILDFSNISQAEIDEFFARAKVSTKLTSGIRIVGNQNLEKLDFGEITEWLPTNPPPNELAVEIRNNPKLKEISWKVTIFAPNQKVQILFYNNPLFDPKTIDLTVFDGMKDNNSYIQAVVNECIFQDPLDPAVYTLPSQDLLDVCKVIKGDLNLEGREIKKEVTLADKDKCLRLVNVNMTKGSIKVGQPKTGQLTCNGITSEIRDNPGLCGEKMTAVAGYFDTIKPTIKLDMTGCAIQCDRVAALKEYTVCTEINDNADIGQWFHNDSWAYKRDKLLSATGDLTIQNTNAVTLSLVRLETAKGLVIKNNQDLTKLEMMSLRQAESLTITDNPKLTVDKIQFSPMFTLRQPDKSTVHCNVPSAVTDVTQLRLCTHIKGGLVLDGLKNDVKPADLSIKEVAGCLTVQNTGLSNLNFLANTTFTCTGEHKADNNPKLCLPSFLKLKTTGAVGKQKCDKTCTSLADGDCVVFIGDLSIDSNTPSAQLKDLKTIEGNLKVDGTTQVNLDFPKLEEISSSKVPALQVSNNVKLETLKMPKIANIMVVGGAMPVISIYNNPKLKDLHFLPSSQRAACTNGGAACNYVGAGKGSAQGQTGSDVPWLLVGGIAGGALLLVGLVGAGIYNRKWIKSKLTKKGKVAERGKVADQDGDQLLPLEKTQMEKEEDGVTVADTRKEHVSTFLYWFDQAVKLNHNHMELANVVAMMAMAEGLLSRKPAVYDLNIHYISATVQDFLPPYLTVLETAKRRVEKDYEELPKKSTASPPTQLKTVEQLHIGLGFKQSFKTTDKVKSRNVFKFVEKDKPQVRNHNLIKSRQMTQEFLNSLGEYLNLLTEVTEYLTPGCMLGNFEAFAKIPWYRLAEVAWEESIVVHTDSLEVYMLMYMVLKTYDVFRRCPSSLYDKKKEDHYDEMLYLFNEAFQDGYDSSYPTHVYYLWLYLTLELFVGLLKDEAWYKLSHGYVEHIPDLKKPFDRMNAGIGKMEKMMNEIKLRIEKMAQANDGDKISMGKVNGQDIFETVNRKPERMKLYWPSATDKGNDRSLPKYAPQEHLRFYDINGENIGPERLAKPGVSIENFGGCNLARRRDTERRLEAKAQEEREKNTNEKTFEQFPDLEEQPANQEQNNAEVSKKGGSTKTAAGQGTPAQNKTNGEKKGGSTKTAAGQGTPAQNKTNGEKKGGSTKTAAGQGTPAQNKTNGEKKGGSTKTAAGSHDVMKTANNSKDVASKEAASKEVATARGQPNN